MLSRRFRNLLLCLLLSLFFGTSAYAKNKDNALNHISGYVLSGDTPIAYPDVRLYQAGTKRRATGGKLQGKATTNESGYFDIAYKSHPKSKKKSPHQSKDKSQDKANNKGKDKSEAVLYLIAEGDKKRSGQSPIKLAAVLDSSNIPAEVYLTERSTVATAYAMAQYTDGRSIGGKNPGLKNAAGTAQNLADLSNGEVSKLLKTKPNGELTSTLRGFNSLANMLAACVQEASNCAALFSAAKPLRGPEPRNTFAAMGLSQQRYQMRHSNCRKP